MKRTFLEFVEKKEKGQDPLTSKISLGEDNDFKPFIVSDDPNSQFYGKNSGLAPIIRAFKKGANWGWSKDGKTGEDKPVKTGGKKLFLTGGALRDHLAGKTAKHVELVTDSSPDEIAQILKQNKFKDTGDKDTKEPNTFFISKKNAGGRPFKYGIRVKGDLYEMSTFTKNIDPNKHEPGSQIDDANSRDFTFNAMYLPLTNDDGPNKDLMDFFGGAHHLKSGDVRPIGNLEDKVTEDPSRALRYARMLTRYGKTGRPEDAEIIKKHSDLVGELNPEDISSEFFKGMDYDDCDCNKYLKNYKDLGLLKHVFPGEEKFDLNIPSEVSSMGDKNAVLAWMLKGQKPDDIEKNMSNRIDKEKLKKILMFVKSLGIPEMDDIGMGGLKIQYLLSGIPEKKLRLWLDKASVKPDVVDKFLKGK
jgi:tRNA nucleotidyltransferase/poly(A) polymerase